MSEQICAEVLTEDLSVFGILRDQVEHVLGLHDLLEGKKHNLFE